MANCGSCDTENVSEAKFCRHCGRGLEQGVVRGGVLSWWTLGVATATLALAILLRVAPEHAIFTVFDCACGASLALSAAGWFVVGALPSSAARHRVQLAMVVLLVGMVYSIPMRIGAWTGWFGM